VGQPLLYKILGQSDRVGAKSLVVPQPYDLAKKVQLTLIGSPLRAFQWAQDGHRTLSLSPQMVAQKRKMSNTISFTWLMFSSVRALRSLPLPRRLSTVPVSLNFLSNVLLLLFVHQSFLRKFLILSTVSHYIPSNDIFFIRMLPSSKKTMFTKMQLWSRN